MDIGSIFLILAILVLVAVYIAQPLMQRNATPISDEEHEYSALLADRDRILKTLQELDFDHSLGKIPEDIYPSQRTALLQHGAAILQKIDAYQGQPALDDVTARLEAAMETHSEDDADSTGIEDDPLEAMIANRLRTREGKSSGFCPQCGHAVQQTDRFCPKCGHSLS
jgi:rubrerythrin